MALDKDQKKFIRKKVQNLGSVELVKKYYNRECAVDAYANKMAKILFEEDD